MSTTMQSAGADRNWFAAQDGHAADAQDASGVPVQDAAETLFRTRRPVAELDWDEVGDTWPREPEHERGAHYDEIDPRGFVP